MYYPYLPADRDFMIKKGSFGDFIFCEHRMLTWCIIAFLILHFIFLKILYPHTLVVGDGHHYIRVANNNLEISGWPIGYPKFLTGLHWLVRGDWIVGTVQYVLMEGVVIYFYFTIRYLLRPGKWVSIFMLICLLVNPFILFISNYVLSDGLFATLTVLWFTLTLWYIYKPGIIYAYMLVIVMILAYSIRYYAMFYPLIAFPIILFSKTRWWVKISSIALACLLLLVFRWYTENLFERAIGRREFSPLSGWRLAGNALIMYRHIQNRDADIAPPELQQLHQIVLHELAVMPPPEVIPDKLLVNYFTFQPSSPLSKYVGVFFGDYITTEEIHKWCSVGKIFGQYGAWLIKRHPAEYIQYYVGQGLDWYINPKVDITNEFPRPGLPLLAETRNWFGTKSVWWAFNSKNLYSVTYFPAITTVLNLLFILGVVGFFYCKCYKTAGSVVNKVIIVAAAYWLLAFLFIIFTTPNLLRYGLSGMIFNIALVPALLERVYLSGRTPHTLFEPIVPEAKDLSATQ